MKFPRLSISCYSTFTPLNWIQWLEFLHQLYLFDNLCRHVSSFYTAETVSSNFRIHVKMRWVLVAWIIMRELLILWDWRTQQARCPVTTFPKMGQTTIAIPCSSHSLRTSIERNFEDFWDTLYKLRVIIFEYFLLGFLLYDNHNCAYLYYEQLQLQIKLRFWSKPIFSKNEIFITFYILRTSPVSIRLKLEIRHVVTNKSCLKYGNNRNTTFI